jgi:uncharacterized protein (TIGR03118 family)
MQPRHFLDALRLPSALRGAARLLPALLVLSACGGSGSSGMSILSPSPTPSSPMSPSPAPQSDYMLTYLVASGSTTAALRTDPRLVNAWGLAFNPTGPAWISDAGSNYSSLYDGNGNSPASSGYGNAPAYVTIPAGASGTAGPTGIVYNPTAGFAMPGTSAAATFLFDTLGGSIEGWTMSVNPSSAVVIYNSPSAATFTGLTMGTDGNGNDYLYAADFRNGKIEVFNSAFAPVTAGFSFYDAAIPAGYAPYNVQDIPTAGGATRIYVTYAQPSTSAQHVAIGAGLGYVAAFQWDGTLISTLVSQGALNAPWGLAIAPSNFGPMSGALLVGNFGDGAVNAYDPTTGASMGPLILSNGQQLFVPGLWAIAFGNGVNNQPSNTLFFTGGPETQTAGVYGRIDLAGTYTPP